MIIENFLNRYHLQCLQFLNGFSLIHHMRTGNYSKGVYHDAVIGLLSNAGYLLISCWIETDVDMKDWETKGK